MSKVNKTLNIVKIKTKNTKNYIRILMILYSANIIQLYDIVKISKKIY